MALDTCPLQSGRGNCFSRWTSGCGKSTLLRLLAGLDNPNTANGGSCGQITGPVPNGFGFSGSQSVSLGSTVFVANIQLVCRSRQAARRNETRWTNYAPGRGLKTCANAYPHSSFPVAWAARCLGASADQSSQVLLLDERSARSRFTRMRMAGRSAAPLANPPHHHAPRHARH